MTKSKTRKDLLRLFLSDLNKDYYLSEIEKELDISRGNIRRELTNLLKDGLFIKYKKGRLTYYHLNTSSVLYNAIRLLMGRNSQSSNNIIEEGYKWIFRASPVNIPEDQYCPTRDIFQSRLESFNTRLENIIGTDAYLVTAIAGEIGNNSFDHNLGNWPNIPGVYFAYDISTRIIVLADRGQGVLKTISRVLPKIKTDKDAIYIAFTKTISGRLPEKRGNGLKFVSQNIKDKKWSLQFDSGHSSLNINHEGRMRIEDVKRNIKGCFAVIKY